MVIALQNTMDDLKKACEEIKDVLPQVEDEFLEANPGEPLDQVGILRLVLNLAHDGYRKKYGPQYDNIYALGPVVEKWRMELAKKK
ncbi:MAG: hypothetical protein E3J71_05900 [Candidatus Stahlbacteria bacterium]|nr:MAG: hypothetical protein E3J71_05900 [Candidatus Stahlbacteria bacterium]